MTTKTAKPSQLPQPVDQLVQIARSRAGRELGQLRLRLERGQRDYSAQSLRMRVNAQAGPAAEQMLKASAQANSETERLISETESLSDRDAVLRFVPEAAEDTWHAPQRPAF